MSSTRVRRGPALTCLLRLLTAVLLCAVVVPTVPVVAASAQPAGVDLLGTMPPADAEVARPPEVARAVFNRPVEPSGPGMEVRNAQGEQVDGGVVEPTPSPAVIDATLPADLPAGEYRASWQVRDETGQVAEGSWTFVVLEPPEPGAGDDTGSTSSDSRGLVVALALLALLLAAGSLWFARGRLE